MSLDDVASYALYVSSVSTFWHVFCCQQQSCVCWQNLIGFLLIHSGDKQQKALGRDVARISWTRVSLPAYKQQACCAVNRYDSTYSQAQKSFAPIKHSTGTSRRLNCELFRVFSKKIMHVRASVQARGWPFLTCV